jgi:hypothetical protein
MRGTLGLCCDIVQVPSRNFDWLPFTLLVVFSDLSLTYVIISDLRERLGVAQVHHIVIVNHCLNHASHYALGLFATSSKKIQAKALEVNIHEAQD